MARFLRRVRSLALVPVLLLLAVLVAGFGPGLVAQKLTIAQIAQTRPVLVISGTVSTTVTVSRLTRYLEDQGRDVTAMSLSWFGLARTDDSVQKLREKIAAVKAETGAESIDVVGWSQGAHVARRYLQLDGTDDVETLVMLGSPTTDWSWMSHLNSWTWGVCAAMFGNCQDQTISSPLLRAMNDGPDMPEGVIVVNVYSTNDRIVTPSPQASLLRDGNTGTQFSVQDVCPERRTGHFGLVTDVVALRIVEQSLQGKKVRADADCDVPSVWL